MRLFSSIGTGILIGIAFFVSKEVLFDEPEKLTSRVDSSASTQETNGEETPNYLGGESEFKFSFNDEAEPEGNPSNSQSESAITAPASEYSLEDVNQAIVSGNEPALQAYLSNGLDPNSIINVKAKKCLCCI